MIHDGLAFHRRVDGRFQGDKAFSATPDYVIVLEGVLLNKLELFKDESVDDVPTLLASMLKKHGVNETLKRLRGPFSGSILDRTANTLHTFANQTGDTAAYIYKGPAPDTVVASNSFDLVMMVAGENNMETTFDAMAARYMLSFGYMLDETTFTEQVKRVLPGRVSALNQRTHSRTTATYFSLRDAPPFIGTRREAVDTIDKAFQKAVARCFEKDLEYGYTSHLVDVSGGLDSRMVNWVARRLGYSSLVNMCFAQPGSDELRMALSVAKQLGNDVLVMPLDSGNYLADAEQILRLNGSAAFYAGITGGKRFLETLSFEHFGLEHTGQLGDVVLGTFSTTSAPDQPPSVGSERYSDTLEFDFQSIVSERWVHQEDYLMETRGFLGALSTHATRKEHTYAVSPFIDVDFLNLCFSLPSGWRVKHGLYGDWVSSRYREAIELRSTRVIPSHMSRVGRARWHAGRVRRRLQRTVRGALAQAGLVASAQSPNSMNPFDYWYATNPRIREMIDSQLERSSQITPEIDRAVGTLVSSGRVIDKLLAASVVTTHSLYFAPGAAAQGA